MTSPEHTKAWQRIAANSQTLVRSRIEIAAILESIADAGLQLVSNCETLDQLFIARLQRVCAEQNFIAVGFSDNKKANAQVIAGSGVILGASHRLGQVSFMACHAHGNYDGEPSIRFDFPDVLYIAQRRVHQRIRVASGSGLHCLADSGGFASFEASIVDIGLSGIGVMVHDAAITLAPGSVLHACRIALPDGNVVSVDLEVMHSTNSPLPDGRIGRRTGCRFIGAPEAIDPLLKVYVLDLEGHDPDRAG